MLLDSFSPVPSSGKSDANLAEMAQTGELSGREPLTVRFRDGKLAHEHIYCDQASVLAQLGVLDPQKLPIAGVASARKVLDPALPANALIRRA